MAKPSIIISSKNSMFDTKIDIKITGLKSNQCVSLHGLTTIDNGSKFESLAVYDADENGQIDLSKHESIGGTFIGIEPMGLFWSMKPSLANKRPFARLAKLDVTTPLVYTICIYDGLIKSTEDFHKIRDTAGLRERQLHCVSLNRWFMARGTKRIELTLEKDGICGILFIPPGKGPFPGVMTLFGTYPGTMEYKAALLASHGFAALALAFIGLPGLCKLSYFMEIKLEYFEKAAKIMLQHPKVDENAGLGVIGISFATSIILAMGALLPCIKCVIWLSGMHFTMSGRVCYKDKIFFEQDYTNTETGLVAMGPHSLFCGRNVFPVHDSPFCKDLDSSRIPFYQRHDVGYMFIAGLSDISLKAEYSLNQAEKMLVAANHPNYKLLRYPGAGHIIEPCYGNHHEFSPMKLFGFILGWGGKTVPHCKAQEDSWPKQIDFLKSNLKQKCHSKL